VLPVDKPVTESAAGNVIQKERTTQKLTGEITERIGEEIMSNSKKDNFCISCGNLCWGKGCHRCIKIKKNSKVSKWKIHKLRHL